MNSGDSALYLMIPMAAVAVVQLASLYLFLSLKREIRSMEKRLERPPVAAAPVQPVLPAPVAESLPPSRPAQGMNLTRREQVLRMSRRGERPEQIAAALGIPRNEVDLLLKVHHATSAV